VNGLQIIQADKATKSKIKELQMATIQKVTARVFCQLPGRGGNPVSVFYGANLDSDIQREKLATSCEWESAFMSSSKLYFHMPTGEQVSFCAHAAMGSAFVRFKRGEGDKTTAIITADCGGQAGSAYDSIVHDEGDIVCLRMKAAWSEKKVPNTPLLHRMLREFHGVKAKDAGDLPTFVNSSVARPKTLVYVPNVGEVKVPAVHSSYRQACDAIDSTGLYFFSDRSDEVGAWECVSCCDPRLDSIRILVFSQFNKAAISPCIGISRRPSNRYSSRCLGRELA
jgi:predicted PhzF superfamily epimerase YddE/YHI9